MTNEDLQEKLVRLVKDNEREREENNLLREAAKIIFRRDQDDDNTPILLRTVANTKIYVKLTARFAESYEELK